MLRQCATTAITAVHAASIMFAMAAMLGRLVAQLKMPRLDAYSCAAKFPRQGASVAHRRSRLRPRQCQDSQFLGPPRATQRHIAAQWLGGSNPGCATSHLRRDAAMVIGHVKRHSLRLQSFGRGLTSRSSRRPTTASRRAGEAVCVYHRPRRPGVLPQRSA